MRPFAWLSFAALLNLSLAVAWSPVASAQTGAAATAASAAAPQRWNHLNAYQVWRDELPDSIPADQIEVRVDARPADCSPEPKRFLGLPVMTVRPQMADFCKSLDAFLRQQPSPLPLPTSLVAKGIADTASVSAAVASLEPAPTRHYVALVRWGHVEDRQGPYWLLEEVLFDREQGRWLWHAGRRYENRFDREWGPRLRNATLAAQFLHGLPQSLASRGTHRIQVPLAGARWVAPAEAATWQPEPDRAGLIVVSNWGRFAYLNIWGVGIRRAGEAIATPSPQPEGTTHLHYQVRPQHAPPMHLNTYFIVDLPPGEYIVWAEYQGDRPIELQAGQRRLLAIDRGLFNATLLGEEDLARWPRLLPRLRHAFAADPPDRGVPGSVPYFQNA